MKEVKLQTGHNNCGCYVENTDLGIKIYKCLGHRHNKKHIIFLVTILTNSENKNERI